MPSREKIAENLSTLHAQQNRRARWVWATLIVIAIVGVVAAYQVMGWALPRLGQQ